MMGRLEVALAGLLAVVGAACGGGPASPSNAPVAAPPSSPSPVGAGLERDEVVSVVRGEHQGIAACAALASSAAEAGVIEISWTITSAGSVTGASVTDSSFPEPAVADCVLRAVERLKFPTATAETPATWRYRFGRPSGG
ncbi:MAG: AgmX/PglI C-terminal domain-containing protein [Sorangiineae bacterium]|nr:AgmX/PglI C-terminal domain-containing protein [Polyangiaceae bacterium]MEB2321854.1 AgmX/PglI C-terminal domain-containing protein [Sorangiineae bacterium]